MLTLLGVCFTPLSRGADENWRTDGTAGTWTGTNWSAAPSPTGGTGWTAGNNAVFSANSTVTYVTATLFANVTLGIGITVNVTQAGTASAAAHVFDIGSGSTLNWASQNYTAAGTSFTKNGLGTWNIAAIGNAYTGGFTLNAGTVIVGGNNSFGNSTLAINGGNIQTSGTRAYAPTAITVGGDFTISGTGNATWGGTVALGTAVRTITNNQTSGSGIFSGVVSGGAGGGLAFGGAGVDVLSNANTYSAGTTLNSGTLALGSSSTVTAGVVASGPVGTGTLSLAGGALSSNSSTARTLENNLSMSGTITLGDATNTGLLTFDSTGLTTAATVNLTGNTTLTLASNVTIANAITGGSSTLSKAGAGTLTLSGGAANTYTGLTTVSAGELDLNKTAGVNAIAGDGAGNTVSNDVNVTGGTLKWLNNEQVENHATITVAGGTVDLAGFTETLGSLVVNSGNFTTNGSGTGGSLIGTTATVDFEGGVSTITNGGSVTDGHIIVGSGIGAVGSGNSVEVQGGGTMTLVSGGIGMVMSGGTLTLDSSGGTAGKLVLPNQIPATITSTGNSSIVSGAGGSNPGAINMSTGNSTFNVSSGTLTVSAQLTNGALTATGAGTLILSGANTYSGGTNVNGGTLLANSGSGLSSTGAGGVMVNSGGTLGGTGFINAGLNNINIGKDTVGMSTGNGGTITGATNGTVGALTMTAANVIFGGVSGDLGTYLVDLTASASDRLVITGNLDLSSVFDQISFQGTTGLASYQLITYTGILSGTFDTVSSLPSGYTLVYGANEIDLVTAVPETSTWVMGALALSTLLYSQRRRFARRA